MTLVVQVILNIKLSNLNNISKFHVYFPVEKFSVSKKTSMIFKAFRYIYILQICKENMFSISYLCKFYVYFIFNF